VGTSNFMAIGVKFGVTTSELSFVFVNRWSLYIGKPDFTCRIQNFQKRFRTFRGLDRLTNFAHNPQTQINIT
jgi:hypothetical protein